MLYEIMREVPEMRDRSRMNHDHRLWILYRKARGESVPWMAKASGIQLGAITSFLKRARADTSVFSRAGYVVEIRTGYNKRDRYWFCRDCSEVTKTEAFANKHAATHVFKNLPWD